MSPSSTGSSCRRRTPARTMAARSMGVMTRRMMKKAANALTNANGSGDGPPTVMWAYMRYMTTAAGA